MACGMGFLLALTSWGYGAGGLQCVVMIFVAWEVEFFVWLLGRFGHVWRLVGLNLGHPSLGVGAAMVAGPFVL